MLSWILVSLTALPSTVVSPQTVILASPWCYTYPASTPSLKLFVLKVLDAICSKKDLSRAYRQLRIDPRNLHLLGYRHNNMLYFDVAPPFGLRSSAMKCQQTTNAVTHMFHALGYSFTNYIDDFGGAEIPDLSAQAFNALGDLFASLGLQSSPDKDCSPTTTMVFLGVQFDTLAMAMSITPECIEELHHRCTSSLSLSRITRHDLQSLLGVMSFVTACVCPARVFMSTLLNTLCLYKHSRFCILSDENKADLRWWCHFLPHYNGVSLIKMSPWIKKTQHKQMHLVLLLVKIDIIQSMFILN